MTGYGTVLDTPRLHLALRRGDLAVGRVAPRRAGREEFELVIVGLMARHLDGLAALGKRERVETEAASARQPGTYLEPFALRALGLVREDETLVERAAEHFEALGLGWHAARTPELRSSQ